jgi:hemoglobin-like flavoprotein
MPFPRFTPAEIDRLRSSFFLLIPVTIDLAESFYGRLFSEHPEVRSYFKSDMESQQDKLIDTLAALLDIVDRPDDATAVLHALGKRHVAYGATEPLYVWVENALLEMVGAELPVEDAEEIGALWRRLMTAVSETMLEGASC